MFLTPSVVFGDVPENLLYLPERTIQIAYGRKRGLFSLADGRVMAARAGAVPDGCVALNPLTAGELDLSEGDELALKVTTWASASAVTLTPLLPLEEEPVKAWLERLIDVPLRSGNIITHRWAGKVARFLVETTTPGGWVLLTASTKLKIGRHDPNNANDVGYHSIGGLDDALAQVRELVEHPLRYPEAFAALGIAPPKGVLLYGPPGTGKTLIARALARETDAWFTAISGPEIIGKYYGESEERLRAVFEKARANAPSLLFIDEIDAIAPRRVDVGANQQVERRVVSQLLTLMDGLNQNSNVVVLAATNLPGAVDSALRRPGRFDREIEVPPPSLEGRRQILAVHTRDMPLASDVNLDHWAGLTSGFVGADLAALAKEAAMVALRELLGDNPSRAELAKRLEGVAITDAHIQAAFKAVRPSASRALKRELPPAEWSDVPSWALSLKEKVDAFFEGSPWTGALLSGGRGAGKTLALRAALRGRPAVVLDSATLMGLDAHAAVNRLAEAFELARRLAPALVAIDDLDLLMAHPLGKALSTALRLHLRRAQDLAFIATARHEASELAGLFGLELIKEEDHAQ